MHAVSSHGPIRRVGIGAIAAADVTALARSDPSFPCAEATQPRDSTELSYEYRRPHCRPDPPAAGALRRIGRPGPGCDGIITNAVILSVTVIIPAVDRSVKLDPWTSISGPSLILTCSSQGFSQGFSLEQDGVFQAVGPRLLCHLLTGQQCDQQAPEGQGKGSQE